MSKSVLHISTECYPAAKAGGMADVVGALPLYLTEHGWTPSVIIPKYNLKWFKNQVFKEVYSDVLNMDFVEYKYSIQKCQSKDLGYDFYCVDIPVLYDRESVYLGDDGHGYADEAQRNVALQRCTLQWLEHSDMQVDLIHCHDHQTGFVPFMIKHGYGYESLRHIPTFYTIHNGAYNSRYGWNQKTLLVDFPAELEMTIDWHFAMDAVAAAMRYADHVNAVSPTYLEELKTSLAPLKINMDIDPSRFSGILNGIDDQTWDPKKDDLLPHKLGRSWDTFKKKNKMALLPADIYRAEDVPLISFIGRFAHQKGADLLAPAIERILARFGFVNFFILGSGDKFLEQMVQSLRDRYPERVACYIGYNEAVAHQVYAASDFLLMPSRFEPCGLNQLFSMRYGTIPVARKTGGLRDTVIDYTEGGAGISFEWDSVDDLIGAISRSLQLYRATKEFKEVRDRGIQQDNSWNNSAKTYAEIYNELQHKLS